MVPHLFSLSLLGGSKAHSLELSNFCAGLSGVPDDGTPDYWSFIVLFFFSVIFCLLVFRFKDSVF
jgi:hypothetical protein